MSRELQDKINATIVSTHILYDEADLFAPGFQRGVAELLAASLEAYLAENGLDPDRILGRPVPNGNFAASEAGVTWPVKDSGRRG